MEQVKLETEMVQLGADHYRKMVQNAKDPGWRKDKSGKYPPEMTRIQAYRRVMLKIVEEMGEAMKAWFHNYKTKRGATTPAAYERLKGMDPHVLAFITARTIMDNACNQQTYLYGVARTIGQECEQELRMAAWIKAEPALWAEVQKGLKQQRATDEHRRKVNVNRFNTLIRDDVQWRNWTTEEKANVGLTLIGILCRVTDDITVEEEDKMLNPTGKGNGHMVIRLSDALMKHLANALDRDERREPYYMPTLIPPKRWNGVREGGYYTKFVRIPWLIRFNADNEEVKGIAADEYDSLDMPRVVQAVHLVQETPWRINHRVLKVAVRLWDSNAGLAGLARQDPRELPPKPPGFDKMIEKVKAWEKKHKTKKVKPEPPKALAPAIEAIRLWRNKAAMVYGENARRVSHAKATSECLRLAMRFKDREFYFPHMLDFRGRMYPIPMYLHPQGHDLARGLLTFANGKPVKEEDAGWLAVHLANCWGNDKISNDARVAWVFEHEAMWRRIAADPCASLEWANRGDPWQTLAAIIEWVRFLEEGPGMVSSLPIRVDGTCNGIQHLSALMLDERAGREVNLIPDDHPHDIYAVEGRALETMLEGIRDGAGLPGQQADWWLQRFPGGIPRGLTKGPVMVLPYGGTKDSYFHAIHKWLNEVDPEGETFGHKERSKMVPFLKERLWSTVADGEIMKRSMECMQWLKDCAAVVAETGLPIFWTTPTGFHVRHFYGQAKAHKVETKIDGKRIQLKIYKHTKELSKRDQYQGIAPNFVHSLDASANMETCILFHEQNEEDPPCYTSIHDAYGTTAGQMWSLYHCLRRAFVKVHSTDMLQSFRERCVIMYRDHLYMHDTGRSLEECWEIADDTLPRLPEKGLLDLSLIEKSDYFFA
jgi:DNA-directed RNA polymerase